MARHGEHYIRKLEEESGQKAHRPPEGQCVHIDADANPPGPPGLPNEMEHEEAEEHQCRALLAQASAVLAVHVRS